MQVFAGCTEGLRQIRGGSGGDKGNCKAEATCEKEPQTSEPCDHIGSKGVDFLISSTWKRLEKNMNIDMETGALQRLGFQRLGFLTSRE